MSAAGPARSFVSCIVGALALAGALACDVGAPGTFPPEDPQLAEANASTGDPHRGRFPFELAVAGLPESGQLRATITTDSGAIRCRLFADVSPLAVANFVGLARGERPFYDPNLGSWTTRPYYDGLSFHRAQERVFVQGGRLGEDESVGFVLQDERSIGTRFDKSGVLALGNRGPNTSAAQFFITTELAPSLDGDYTILGRCEDLLVVRELEARVLAGERPIIESVGITRE
ncbi:peptidylprolyl cis-trans isomerase, cyclophilin-type [Plesiocystis pacifica SIR-1]|uniref:Peptidyl-prolyl cis-trans isomerase n=1 Tax=Plesiocystis pacifica SIR-1 TaxID=391625 RepID=A6G2Z6_9BACT|nr:peptidylprolyl isomerase [Plesiocystis pacifica]EDM79846.1 peptidylprolyl cis-trans isomerase, cyclophilin-type [Plesiocystis pacifica SIR-1]